MQKIQSKRTGFTVLALSAALVLGLATMAACSDSEDEPGTDTGADTASDTGETDAADVEQDAEPDTGQDVGQDTGETDAEDFEPGCEPWWESIAATTDGPGAGTDGTDPDLTWSEGVARGGRLRTGDGGFAGPYAHCRTGDWVLENDHLRLCIADERSMTPMLFEGGNIMDIERRDAPGLDELYYMIPASKFINQGAQDVTLLSDGSDGSAAVLQVRGQDMLTMFGAATIGPGLFSSVWLDFVTEYRLAPGSEMVEIVTWITRVAPTKGAVVVGDLVGGGDTMRAWFQGFGFNTPSLPAATGLYVSVGGEHSVGVYSDKLQTSLLMLPEIKVPFGNLIHATGVVCPGATATYRRYLATGTGDTLSIRQALAPVMPARPTLEVLFASDEEGPRHVEIRSPDGQSVDVVIVHEATVVDLPAGDYEAHPMDWPSGPAPVVAFSVPQELPVVIPVPDLGALNLIVHRDNGEGPEPGDAMVFVRGPVDDTFVIMNGSGVRMLPPGSYSVHVDNGMELSNWSGAVTLVAGETEQMELTLTRELHSDGWVSGDMHQHATPSPDSQLPIMDRVLANVGAGVDFIAPSDHDAVADFPSAIAALGLSERLFLFQGEELSPGYAHINLFPRSYDRHAPGAGALPVAHVDPETRSFIVPTANEYFAQARSEGIELIQINHPRSVLPYFDSVRYNPIAGPAAVTDSRWSTDFDAIEVYNVRNQFCTGLHDWFSLLNHGLLVTGTGNSDTHNMEVRSGWPRNFLHLGDTPMSERALIDAILNMRVSVSGGILLSFASGLLPGDTLEVDAGEPMTFAVRMQAASWIDYTALAVFVNGVEVDRFFDDARTPGETFDAIQEISLSFERDSYVVFVAYGSDSTPWPSGLRPFGFTNPVFIDVDGDGWTAPGVASAEALPRPTGFPNCGE